jgi:hypothetical protein
VIDFTYEKCDLKPDLTLMNISPGRGQLQHWDIDKVPSHIKVLAYWYENHGYEGSGVAVFTDGISFGYEYLGHCSCYGPTDKDWVFKYSSMTELEKAVISEASWQESGDVIALMKEVTERSAGYGGGYEI